MNLKDELRLESAKFITRRWFFRQCGLGLGSIALASLLDAGNALAAPKPLGLLNPLSPKRPHFQPKAKAVIYLFMGGAPSQLDLFDYKPTLEKYNGQPVQTDGPLIAGYQNRLLTIERATVVARDSRISVDGKLPLDAAFPLSAPAEQLMALDEALEQLAALSPRQAQVVEMRFFVGLTAEETAALLKVSSSQFRWGQRKASILMAVRSPPGHKPELNSV